MNIRKNAFITLFFLLFNIVFSGMCVFASDADTASAIFSATEAQTQNMSATIGTGVTPTLETKGNTTGWRLDASVLRNANIRFDIDNNFLYNLSNDENITVEIEYYDDGHGGFALWYDAVGDVNKTHFVQLQSTNTWKKARFNIYDAQFAGGTNTFDFYILTNDNGFATDAQGIMGQSPTDVLISSVKLIKEDTVSPFDISVKTGKHGNIFFEGDDIIFDISFASDKYSAANTTYTVKDFGGNVVTTKSAPFANNQYELSLSDLKFGVYTLDIAINDGNISQVETIDFSYSKKAENPKRQFGTNVHFNWEAYDRHDIEVMADLAKNAGYYFMRSTIPWDQVEKEKGKYKIPDNVLYAHQYVDKIGLEVLGILSCGNPVHASWPYILNTNAQRKAYGEFCYYVVDALKEYSDYYTSPNEFNLTSGEGGVHHADRYDEFTNIVKAAYPYIKKANPNAYIVSGAVGRFEKEYVENCYKEGILDYCDAFSVHLYDYVGDPETWYIFPEMQRHYDLLKSYDSTKGAWITENGWPSRDVSNSLAWADGIYMSTYERQAQYYARSLLINSDPTRLEGYVHYCFNDANVDYFWVENNFGIIESHDHRTPYAAKPAYISTAAANSILNGYEFKKDLNHSTKDYVYASGGAEYSDPKDYSTHNFAYVFENDKGEEIVAVWGIVGGKFTYESDKPYFEVYDMYGNKTVVENTTGSYTASYTGNPVYIKATDKLDSGYSALENTASSWDIDESEVLNVSVKLPFDAKIGDNASVIIAAYDNMGRLLLAEQDSLSYNGNVINASFSAEKIAGCDTAKLFVFDGFDSIKPLLKTTLIPQFGDDVNISYSLDGDLVTLSGKLSKIAPYHNMTVTAWNENVSKENFITNFSDAILYQDMIMSDANGNYEITFKIPNEQTNGIRVQLSGKDFVMQKTIYPIQ